MDLKLPDRIMRLPEVIWATGKCRTAIYQEIKAGRFPRQRKLGQNKGQRSVGWSQREVEKYIRETLEGGDHSPASSDVDPDDKNGGKRTERGGEDVK